MLKEDKPDYSVNEVIAAARASGEIDTQIALADPLISSVDSVGWKRFWDFRDLPPSQIVLRLADMGQYVASESTMERLLRESEQDTHRGKKRAPRKVSKPREKVATAPGQVFSWDITYLRSLIRGE